MLVHFAKIAIFLQMRHVNLRLLLLIVCFIMRNAFLFRNYKGKRLC